jgi:hypothetical protein
MCVRAVISRSRHSIYTAPHKPSSTVFTDLALIDVDMIENYDLLGTWFLDL